MLRYLVLLLIGLAMALFVYLAAPIGATAGYEAHSVRQAGGPVIVDTMRGCERLEHRRKHFDKSRCKRKVHWEREFRQLSDKAKRWLAITGYCESEGHGSVPRYFASYKTNTGNGFFWRYQFSPTTARNADFTISFERVPYYREQDVRAWRWRWNPSSSGASEWPNCAAW